MDETLNMAFHLFPNWPKHSTNNFLELLWSCTSHWTFWNGEDEVEEEENKNSEEEEEVDEKSGNKEEHEDHKFRSHHDEIQDV